MSNVFPFGARRGKWLDQVDADPECTCAYFRIFWHVGQRLNQETFTARPGHRYLAEKARVDIKTVQRALKWAEGRHIQRGGSAGPKDRTITPILSGHNVQSKGGYTGHYTGHSPRVTHGETRGNGPDSQDSHKYKKETEIEVGLPKGPTAPEKARYIPFDSPNWDSVESLSRNLPPTRRPIKDRSGGFLVSADWLATMNGSGKTIAVSS
jgi:hypothetical protein